MVLVGDNKRLPPAARQQKAVLVLAQIKLRHHTFYGGRVLPHKDTQAALRCDSPSVITP